MSIPKVLTLGLDPVTAALFLVVLALLMAMMGWRRTSHTMLFVAVIGLWVAATPAVSDVLLQELESRHVPADIEQSPTAEAIVVLGGTLTPPMPPWYQTNLSATIDRVLHAARLYRAKKARWVVVSGGNRPGAGPIVGPEALQMAALLQEWGVPQANIITESTSTNTFENALFTKRLLKKSGISHVLLVTSAIHMPRAYATFLAADINVLPSPTDYEVNHHPLGWRDWVPSAQAAEGTRRALHELTGLAYYRLRGWAN